MHFPEKNTIKKGHSICFVTNTAHLVGNFVEVCIYMDVCIFFLEVHCMVTLTSLSTKDHKEKV